MRHIAHSVASQRLAQWLWALALCVLVSPSWAQVTVNTQLSHRTQYVNDPIEFRIVVDGTTQGTAPDAPVIDGVEVEFITSAPRSSRSISFINGRRTEQVTESVTFIYRIIARTPGRYIVPAMTVRSGASELTTRDLAFEIISPERPDEFVLTAQLDTNEVFVGEPVQLQLVWYVGLEVESASFERNQSIDGLSVIPRQDPTYNLGRRSENLQAFGIFSDVTTAQLGRGELDGRRYTTVTIDATLVPERPGTFEVGPLGVDFSFSRPGERRVFRGESVSDELQLTVRPLPMSGKPEHFDRLIGAHAIEASIDRDTVGVGDPITLRVDIESTNPHSLLRDAPDLERIPKFASAFKADSDGWEALPGRAPGTWAFTQTIRANNETVDAIPEIPLWWFDPQTQQYTRSASQPVPLTVRPTLIVTAADAMGAAPQSRNGTSGANTPGLPVLNAEPQMLGDAAAGLWALDREPLRSPRAVLPYLLSSAVDGSEPATTQFRLLFIALLVPPALITAAWGAKAIRRKRDPSRILMLRSRAQALKAIRTATRLDELGNALNRFAITARGGPEAAACSADLFALLKHTKILLPEDLAAVCEQPEAQRFGRAVSSHPPTPEQRAKSAQLVRTLTDRLLDDLEPLSSDHVRLSAGQEAV
jgi:hypothetical protein